MRGQRQAQIAIHPSKISNALIYIANYLCRMWANANLTTKIVKTADLTTQTAIPGMNHADRLLNWAPESWPVSPGWRPIVSQFLSSETAGHLSRFVRNRLAQGAVVYPAQPFRALALTSPDRVKVVILGQDPYHGPGQAQGLAFSVAPGVKIPPSLRNIFKEIAREVSAKSVILTGPTAAPSANASQNAPHGSLLAWAQQGVLLLNTCLTVEQGQPASHVKQGWEVLTDGVIQAVEASQNPVVFMLWGSHAQAKRDLILNPMAKSAGKAGGAGNGGGGGEVGAPRLVLTANHPSPLSALRPPAPFIGCGHFGAANAFLVANGLAPIAWV